MLSVQQVEQMFSRYGGVMRTGQLSAERVYYPELQQLLSAGILEKLRTGCYRVAGQPMNEMQTVMSLFPDAVLCGETALHYYGYITAKPFEWNLAVSKDSGKSRFRLDYPFVKPYYIEPSLVEIGSDLIETADGTARIYDRERVICDCLRYRNKMERSVFSQALKNYIADPQKNLPRLFEYATQLRVAKTARETLGLWL